jgi:hypothetical protein
VNRRTILATLGSLLTSAGCLTERETGTVASETAVATRTTAASESATPEKTTQTRSVTETAPATTTATATPDRTADDFLPVSGDGWRLDSTEQEDWRYLGGSDGVRGVYTAPDGVVFHVVVMRVSDPNTPEQIARNWKCSGQWSAVVTFREFVLAASSGTKQPPRTPDFAPWMSETPHPETAEEARELLARSPVLTPDAVASSGVVCSD